MNTMNILPLDFKSISQIFVNEGNNSQSLSYKMIQNSTDITDLIVDISSCDPDSIKVSKSSKDITISGLYVLDSSIFNLQIPTLSRNVQLNIPLPNSIHPDSIRVSVDEQSLILSIPVKDTIFSSK